MVVGTGLAAATSLGATVDVVVGAGAAVVLVVDVTTLGAAVVAVGASVEVVMGAAGAAVTWSLGTVSSAAADSTRRLRRLPGGEGRRAATASRPKATTMIAPIQTRRRCTASSSTR